MLFNFLSFYCPIMIVILILLRVFIILSWQQVSKHKNLYFMNLNHINSGKFFKNITNTFLECFIIFTVIYVFFFFFLLKVYSFNFIFFYFKNTIITELKLFSLFFLLIMFVFYKKPKTSSKYSVDFIWIFISLFFLSFLMLLSVNILSIFIILEIINIIIFFSYLKTSIKFSSNASQNYSKKEIHWLITTLTYQFILNFFSSILFFFSYNVIVSYSLSSTFTIFNQLELINFKLSMYLIFFYLSFFMKFGIGPWIFFKIEIYENFNYFLLIIYTIIYFTIILTFFFNLFFIFVLPLKSIYTTLFFSIFLIVSMFFIFLINSYFNIFVFFSFSSLLNLILLLYQFCIIILTVY